MKPEVQETRLYFAGILDGIMDMMIQVHLPLLKAIEAGTIFIFKIELYSELLKRAGDVEKDSKPYDKGVFEGRSRVLRLLRAEVGCEFNSGVQRMINQKVLSDLELPVAVVDLMEFDEPQIAIAESSAPPKAATK